ncbi:TIGR04282 family arsenosugar biosynthesis glycosyltransferase [Loigolactobacillus backii]|uniref:TIGR04282 family arsenosugar biosynthesis glycosyltransferase n=1 Tax=Loigolactobacillus backii TaxID=375175 RepID=UPI0022FD532C|nr:TIGR04282 family arsenosugar biosynthesis glycosyltransferase [Loigolactobacillus backii]MDA5386815.1 TIGR04282 family arsenosugar biosynthesis glycosyltransferase [Loigolactobacillus backii]MDA5389400.1 TIGR04282 family arsenosugar biosynthesis glycosyltransferase [Loigolactobacillus backii]
MNKSAYIIFSKVPEPGYVKTRLEPDLTAIEAARIQSIMLARLVSLSQKLAKTMTIFLAYQGHDLTQTQLFLASLPDWIQVFPQDEGTLGLKMSHAIQRVQDQGYQKVILTGSDIPQLTVAMIESAAQALGQNDVVLGPTFDGGYYLFGTSGCDAAPFLNTDISWSTASVLEATVQLLQESNQQFQLMPTLLDVDFKADADQVAEFIKG